MLKSSTYDLAGYGGSVDSASYGGSVEPLPRPTSQIHFNQGIGNGAEGGDPGKSRPHGGSNDELGQTPGAKGGKANRAYPGVTRSIYASAGYGGSVDSASYGGSVEPLPRPTSQIHFNQGIGNGAEGGDPGKSRPHGGSNDELGQTPGAKGGKTNKAYPGAARSNELERVGKGKDHVEVVPSGKPNKGQLQGSADRDVLFGTRGNDVLTGLAGNDLLKGNDGDDTLDGGVGRDIMMGGRGNDIYFVDDQRDRIVELGGRNQGLDTVNASISWVLGNNLENLVLTGSEPIDGTGNRLNNSITGNTADNQIDGGDGNDVLLGGGGDDTLTGGSGSDQFVYSTGQEFNTLYVGIDTITDFIAGTDKIVLSKATFNVILSVAGDGFSNAADFGVVATDAEANLSSSLIVYSAESNGIFYNQNGSVGGLGTGEKFATLSSMAPGTSLAASDFVIKA